MRKLSIFILALCLVVSSALVVSAASDPVISDLTVIHEAYYIDGSLHQIASNSSGVSYYYVNGILQKHSGFVFVDGYYYYSRTNGDLAVGSYYPTLDSGLLPINRYYEFDSYGRLIDPPYYPDGWEDEWSSVWPFPTEPPETVPPVEPSVPPVIVEPYSPDTVVGLVNSALVFAADLWSQLLDASGMWGYYLAAIIGLLLLRYLLRPIFGGRVRFGGQSDSAAKSRSKDTED